MYHRLHRIPLLLCCAFAGCTANDLELSDSADFENNVVTEGQDRRLEHRGPFLQAAFQNDLVAVGREDMREFLVRTSPGSQVHLVDESDRRYVGTLLSVDPENVELMNCICKETVPGPHGQKQCKTSHVPFQSFKSLSITNVAVLSPAPPDFSSKEAGHDCNDYTVDAIVYMSGRRQRWGKPSEPTASDDGTSSVEGE